MSILHGWVSIHRKIKNNPVWQDPKLLKLWMLCLLEASHKEHEQLVGKQVVKLEPGQFVTGRYALSKSFNDGMKKNDMVPETTLWRWLKWFESNGFVNIKSNTKYSVVSIVNWRQYQQSEQQMNNGKQGLSESIHQTDLKNEHQIKAKNPSVPTVEDSHQENNEQQMDNKWTANGQQVDTNNKGNKGNNDNKNITTTTAPENPVQLFEYLLCRLSPIQMNSLYQWVDDFKGNQEIVNAAIKLADNKNKRNFNFVEFLLKEWHSHNLMDIDRVRAYEREKFNNSKVKPFARKGKGIVRTEMLPDWFEENEQQSKPQPSGQPAVNDGEQMSEFERLMELRKNSGS